MVIENKQYSIGEVFDLLGDEYLLRKTDDSKKSTDMVVDGFNVRPVSLRYMTFYQKGTRCVCCGKEGTHFRLCGDAGTTRRHFNLYADDGSLLTKDHIIPKSKGGRDHVDNMQTMCERCNKGKGNFHPDIRVEYIVATRVGTNNESLFRTMEKAAFHIVSNHLQISKKKHDSLIRASINTVLSIQNSIETGTPYCGFVWTREMR